MRLRLTLSVLLLTGLLLLVTLSTAAEGDYGASDEQAVRAAGLTPDGAALLDFFRKRSQINADPAKVAELIVQLGDKSGELRDRAVGDLISLGPVVLPALRQAVKDPDEPAVADRARRCLQALESNNSAALPVAVARLVAQRRPEGAAEVLLNYLPYSDDENVLEEVKLALTAVAVRDGKPDPALVQVLKDQDSLRRAAAAEALSRIPGEELRQTLRKMLQDPSPAVRMRVALALARTGKDPKAVSTLVASLAEVPLAQARQAEEYLLELAADQAPKAALGNDEASREKARDAWAAWWLATEGPALLEEITRRTLNDEMREKALALIKQCGDDTFEVREKSTNDLQAMGTAIASLLRQFANDGDLEISQRVRKVLANIEKDKSQPLSPVCPRLVALRKPPGSAEALINFLPFAEHDMMIAECRDALAAVAVVGGQVDPFAVKSLTDKHPLKRAVAAEGLWLSGLADPRDAVRALLRDPDPTVRLRVALTLAGDREKDAVPVLINLLTELPFDKALQAEEFLRRVGGDRSPEVVLLSEDKNGPKCRDLWMAWWKDNAARVDLAAATATQRLLGYTMILYINPPRLIEVGMDGKQRWQVDGFQYAYDAQVLPGDKVLIAEYNNLRVTERTLRGEMVWEKRMQLNPISAQRLPNGNTFIATNTQLVEVDKSGKEVLTINRPTGDCAAAQKARDGKIVMITSGGQVVRMDAAGKELKTFMAGQVTLNGLEVLPNGRVLIAHYSNNLVAEYDAEGAKVWEARLTQPSSATRLPNGNTLVACTQGAQQVVEVDRAGNVVWEHKTTNQRPWKVRRR